MIDRSVNLTQVSFLCKFFPASCKRLFGKRSVLSPRRNVNERWAVQGPKRRKPHIWMSCPPQIRLNLLKLFGASGYHDPKLRNA